MKPTFANVVSVCYLRERVQYQQIAVNYEEL